MTPTGEIRLGQQWAASSGQLESLLEAQQLVLLRARPARGLLPTASRSIRLGARRDAVIQLARTLRAGIPLAQALALLAEKGPPDHLADALVQLQVAVATGHPLSVAWAALPEWRDPVTLALLRAGEEAGHLPEMLDKVAARWSKQLALRRQMARMLSYPLLVATVMMLALGVILVYLVPSLSRFLAEVLPELPWQTRMLFAFSAALQGLGEKWLFLLGGGVVGGLLLWKIPAPTKDAWKLRLPVVGPLVQWQGLSRMLSTLACLYGAGIPLLDALPLARPALGNEVLEADMVRVEARVAGGQSLSDAFAMGAGFPPALARHLALGETSGTLEQSLNDLATDYEQAIESLLARLERWLEPSLILGLGGMLLWIALAVLGPLYDLVGRWG